MSKFSDEIKNADEQERQVILAHVSHIDLKKEFCFLVDEIKAVDNVVKTIKAEPKPVVKKVVKSKTKTKDL